MTWFLLTLACIVLWGIADILYKAASNPNDPLCHYKSFVWVGIVMALAGGVMAGLSETLAGSFWVLMDNLYLIPLTIVYALALFFGLLGIKYLDASVVSTLENIDGGMAAIILCFYFFLTGSRDAATGVGVLDILAAVIIVVGVVMLGIQEQKLYRQEAQLSQDQRKPRLGAVALMFPLLYNLVDAASMAAVSITVSDGVGAHMPDNDFFIFECLGFVLVAICVWLYMLIVKKHCYNPFQDGEMIRCGAATGETFGTMTFILAAASQPILTAPITSSYCLVTIVLARIFLKERLTKKQNQGLGILVLGIALLGISEILRA